MIPVLTAGQLRQADAHTIAHEPVASIDLMERAARAASHWLLERYSARACFRVLAGCGNNGGDGLAIARLLADEGATVHVCLVRYRSVLAPDAQTNLDRLNGTSAEMLDMPVGSIPPVPSEDEVVIDALLGFGLDRPIAGWLKDVVVGVNSWKNEVVAIDIPSGLFAEDNTGNDQRAIVRADHVLTFEVPKLALLLPENGAYVGEWHRLPIGLDRDFIEGLGAKDLLMEASDVRELMPDRPRVGHKGTFGHAMVVAGRAGKAGAAVLAARACARSGVGLITVRLPADLQIVMNVALPEAMTLEDPFGKSVSGNARTRFSAIGIGPGVGTGDEAASMLKRFIQEAIAPLVLDADALTILSENRTWLAFLPKRTVLTPHPKEFDRLTEKSATGFERLAKARAFAVRFGIVLVLKGANTAICSPDGTVYFNPSGNPGMAKGGSGDALTGIITGLLAQGSEPVSAAVLGVYAHGLAGDIAAEASGMDGILPGDLVDALPLAWRRIRASS